jgi:hypothetical protein
MDGECVEEDVFGGWWRRLELCYGGGGKLHKTSGLELCYGGGMSIDVSDTNSVYCSVPVDGTYGKVYEIIKYTISNDGNTVSNVSVTKNSAKNNVRPYKIPNTQNVNVKLVWLCGDYYVDAGGCERWVGEIRIRERAGGRAEARTIANGYE